VAQYGQWDGYPEGQGVDILSFLRNADIEKFKNKVLLTTWLTEEERQKRWDDLGVDTSSGWVNAEDSTRHKKLYPEVSRDCGSDILELIYNADGLKLDNSINFAGNSLFCEWAYVIDLDKNTFEVYKGFNKNLLPETERFYGFEQDEDAPEYYPVKLLKTFPLDNLPTEEKFLAEFKENDE